MQYPIYISSPKRQQLKSETDCISQHYKKGEILSSILDLHKYKCMIWNKIMKNSHFDLKSLAHLSLQWVWWLDVKKHFTSLYAVYAVAFFVLICRQKAPIKRLFFHAVNVSWPSRKFIDHPEYKFGIQLQCFIIVTSFPFHMIKNHYEFMCIKKVVRTLFCECKYYFVASKYELGSKSSNFW